MRQKILGFGTSLLSLVFILTPLARAQNSSTPDTEVDRVQSIINQAKKEAEQFAKAGGKPADAANPNLKWSAALWEYRAKHPKSPATIIATIEALRMLYRAEQFAELQTKAETLKLDDPAWKQVIYTLMSAASKSKDYSYLISKAEALTQGAVAGDVKAQARFSIGDAYWRMKDNERARKNFEIVVKEFPGTSYAEDAEGNLHEMAFLNLGQTAPAFERTSLSGNPISIAGFKGKIVVLKFWGTY